MNNYNNVPKVRDEKMNNYNNVPVVKSFIEILSSDDKNVNDAKKIRIYLDKNNMLLSLFYDILENQLANCEFDIRDRDAKHIVSLEFEKDKGYVDYQNLGTDAKTYLKTYNKLTSLSYRLFKDRNFELTSNNVMIIKDLANNKKLNIEDIPNNSDISRKLRYDIESFIDSAKKCIDDVIESHQKLIGTKNYDYIER